MEQQQQQQQEVHDPKFWLPAEFLDEEELHKFVSFNSVKPVNAVGLYGFNSDLSSPVESLTETESDEEDYLSELSRKLAQSTLEDGFWNTESNFHHSKSARVTAGSPQSTLCGCNHVSSRGSSNCASPAPPLRRQVEPPWGVLRAAAVEVARLRMTEPPRKIPSPNHQFHQIQADLKKQQMMKQQLLQQQQQQYHQQFVQQSRVRNVNGNGNGNVNVNGAWPTVKQTQPQSGMRAVFLANPNAKRESAGTGVFLPRQIGAPAEPHKKRGCSTVLLPERVVHALNLNLDAQNRPNGALPRHDYDGEMKYRKSGLMAEQRRQQAEKDLLRLPQEWTY